MFSATCRVTSVTSGGLISYGPSIADQYRRAAGYVDRWIVYGKVDGEQLFTSKELTVEPGAKCTIKDGGAYGLITVQGKGRMNNLALDCPKLIRFHELTEDEVFAMLTDELLHEKRSSILQRLHQRYCALRDARERVEVLSQAVRP